MEAFFEVRGSEFDVDGALRNSPLREYANTWRRGQPTETGKRTWEDSGFSVLVGGGDRAELEEQIDCAAEFLREEAEEIRRLRGLPGIDRACLRFGEMWPEGIAARSPRLPSKLLLACGQLGLDVVLCEYLSAGISEDESNAV